MEFYTWLKYLVVVATMAFLPGSSILLVVSNSTNSGLRGAILTILGDLTANSIQIITVSVGLGPMLTSPVAITVLKICAFVYLFFLCHEFFIIRNVDKFLNRPNTKEYRSYYLDGFFMSILNPKALFFFFILFPTFLNIEQPIIPQLIVLGMTFIAIDGLAMLLYAGLAIRLSSALIKYNNWMSLQSKIRFALLSTMALLIVLY